MKDTKNKSTFVPTNAAFIFCHNIQMKRLFHVDIFLFKRRKWGLFLNFHLVWNAIIFFISQWILFPLRRCCERWQYSTCKHETRLRKKDVHPPKNTSYMIWFYFLFFMLEKQKIKKQINSTFFAKNG